MKPLIRRHVHKADVKPAWTATKYANGADPMGTTPESRQREMTVRSINK